MVHLPIPALLIALMIAPSLSLPIYDPPVPKPPIPDLPTFLEPPVQNDPVPALPLPNFSRLKRTPDERESAPYPPEIVRELGTHLQDNLSSGEYSGRYNELMEHLHSGEKRPGSHVNHVIEAKQISPSYALGVIENFRNPGKGGETDRVLEEKKTSETSHPDDIAAVHFSTKTRLSRAEIRERDAAFREKNGLEPAVPSDERARKRPAGDLEKPEGQKASKKLAEPKGSKKLREPKGSKKLAEPKGSKKLAEPKGSKKLVEPKGSRKPGGPSKS